MIGELRTAGYTRKQILDMDLHVVEDHERPECDVTGCSEIPNYLVSRLNWMQRRVRRYHSSPGHIDTVKAALAYGHSGDPA